MAEAAKRKARAGTAKRPSARRLAVRIDTRRSPGRLQPRRDRNDEQTVAFKLGWNHTIDGKTASNLPTADVDSAGR